MDNVDSSEIAKFATRAGEWWDPSGAFRTLHEINDLRVGYIDARAPLRDMRVLDVGCGGGLLSEAMARRGAAVLGIDLGEANLEAARSHASAGGVAVDYRCVDVELLASERPASFDTVTCLEMLEHVPEPQRVVAACAALLAPGGAAFFSTINRNPEELRARDRRRGIRARPLAPRQPRVSKDDSSVATRRVVSRRAPRGHRAHGPALQSAASELLARR